MKLSLIIPIYNGAEFVANLGNNILRLGQEVGDIEFIIVNDGSTDDTSGQLHAFFAAHRDAGLDYRLLEQANGGVSSARNLALAHASGEYVMFMDHDDNIDADKLAGLLAELYPSDAGLLQFNCAEGFPAHGQIINLPDYMADFPFLSCVWSYVYKRSIIQEHKLQFTVGMKYLEDGLFLLDYMLKTGKVMVSNSRVYDYVDNPASVMRAGRTEAQNQKFLDNVGLAVRGYSDMVGTHPSAAVDTRVKEIRDSFLFIYIINMLKLNVPNEELFGRLKDCGYDFKMANYPSKFNDRLPVRALCSIFRSKPLLGLVARTNALNLVKGVA
ncbi:MAG: glycosyltransferase [Neisseria sp.]|nr:glycosyltransferase [Neisseria sp.]